MVLVPLNINIQKKLKKDGDNLKVRAAQIRKMSVNLFGAYVSDEVRLQNVENSTKVKGKYQPIGADGSVRVDIDVNYNKWDGCTTYGRNDGRFDNIIKLGVLTQKDRMGDIDIRFDGISSAMVPKGTSPSESTREPLSDMLSYIINYIAIIPGASEIIRKELFGSDSIPIEQRLKLFYTLVLNEILIMDKPAIVLRDSDFTNGYYDSRVILYLSKGQGI